MVIVHQNTEITKILLKTEVVQFRRRGFQPSNFIFPTPCPRIFPTSQFLNFHFFSDFAYSEERWSAEIRFITRNVIDNPRISANGDVIPNLDMSNNPSAACDGFVFSNFG